MTGNWIDWFENRSAKENKVAVGTASAGNTMRAVHNGGPCDSHESDSSRIIFQSTRKPRETSNLRNIISHFEKGRLSPLKKKREIDEYKQKNFVKRIVEIFEEKYKIYNDSKTAQEIQKSPEENKSNAAKLESWTERSRRFCNPFKNDSSRSNRNSTNVDEFDGSTLSSEDRIFDTWENNRLIRRRLRELENSKNSVKSKMILTAFGREAPGLELCSTFLPPSSDSSRSPNCLTRAELMRKNYSSDSMKSSDETSVDSYVHSSEETIFSSDYSLPTTSTLIESPRSDNSTLPETSHVDKSPKIIGAFLKKPIDVENTTIDWIPVTGKRLPRKRSLKKLLCSFTRGKLVKRFSSERNLSEESQEFQDVGYDERSCSSMSITSLVSVADVIRHQETTNSFESNRRSELKTFKSRNKSNEEKGEAFCDTYSSVDNQKGKQLVLTEVPREDVKLDLGPSYPPPSQTIRFLSHSVDKLVPRLPEHPCVPKIPENPFVTPTKMDSLEKFNSSYHTYYSNVSPPTIIKNDLYEVEFRRSCSDLSSSNVTNHYDVPRRFLSKSENEIPWMWKSKSNRKEEPIYDIPKSQSIERPRSNI
ncbi:uncharacterized protein [Bombus fervidus]|uniref:uncharacterized protein n=1 Tax=Bombus fervidus TaxID=203811 RepID=UPI003AB461A5